MACRPYINRINGIFRCMVCNDVGTRGSALSAVRPVPVLTQRAAARPYIDTCTEISVDPIYPLIPSMRTHARDISVDLKKSKRWLRGSQRLSGGTKQNRTAVLGFADRCLTTRPWYRLALQMQRYALFLSCAIGAAIFLEIVCMRAQRASARPYIIANIFSKKYSCTVNFR